MRGEGASSMKGQRHEGAARGSATWIHHEATDRTGHDFEAMWSRCLPLSLSPLLGRGLSTQCEM